MARRSRNTKANVVTLDLSGVEGRVNFTEGDHLLEVMEVTREKGNKGDYLSWKFSAAEGDCEGAVVYNNTSLTEQSLWNLRSLLEALGVEIPDEEFDLDLEELVGLTMMGTIELETYEGKKRPRLSDFWPAEEADPEPAPKSRRGKKDSDDDEPKKASRRGGKKAEPEEETLTQDAINDMSEDELEDVIEEHNLDVDLDDYKTLRKQRAAVIDAAQEAGVLADEEDAPEETPEEEERPSRRRSRRGADKDEPEEEKPARRRRRR